MSATPILSPTAVAALRAKAEAGDAAAQFDMFKLLRTQGHDRQEAGEDIADTHPLFQEAIDWCRKSALLGNNQAQNIMGFTCMTGAYGQQRNTLEGLKWAYQGQHGEKSRLKRYLGYAGITILMPPFAGVLFVIHRAAGTTIYRVNRKRQWIKTLPASE